MSGDIEHQRLDVQEIGTEVRLAEEAWRDAVGHALRAGEKLIEAKSLLRHGGWLPWLPFSELPERLLESLPLSLRAGDLVREDVLLFAASSKKRVFLQIKVHVRLRRQIASSQGRGDHRLRLRLFGSQQLGRRAFAGCPAIRVLRRSAHVAEQPS